MLILEKLLCFLPTIISFPELQQVLHQFQVNFQSIYNHQNPRKHSKPLPHPSLSFLCVLHKNYLLRLVVLVSIVKCSYFDPWLIKLFRKKLKYSEEYSKRRFSGPTSFCRIFYYQPCISIPRNSFQILIRTR